MINDDTEKRLDLSELHFEEFFENFYTHLLKIGKFQKGSELGMHALCDSLVLAWNIHITYGVAEGKNKASQMALSQNPKTRAWLADFIKMAIETKDKFFRDDRFVVESAKVSLQNNRPMLEIEFGKEEPL